METKLANKKWKPFVVTLAGTNINDLALFYYSKPSDTEPIGRIPLCSAHVDLLEVLLHEIHVVNPSLNHDRKWL